MVIVMTVMIADHGYGGDHGYGDGHSDDGDDC